MHVIADLHIHSRFSRAVSPQMTIDGIAGWAMKKGIGLVATGDFTHPMWLREIREKLEEDGKGLLRIQHEQQNLLFLLSTEISCIYKQNGKTRRVHVLVWLPSIDGAVQMNKELTKRGCNVLSDGRPIIGLSLIHLAELVLTVDPRALIIPAHIWTPWFSVYGKMGGFESLEEAFGPYVKHIYAVETGLSSSPDMNWRIKELDARSIVSFSDAHSGPKLGREATVFELPELTYQNIEKALQALTHAEVANENLDPSSVAGASSPLTPSLRASEAGQNFVRSPHACKIEYTIEFYPEEGKYHYTGHKDCNVRLTPDEIVSKGTTCPVCGKQLTQGVMQRVAELATRDQRLMIKDKEGLKYYVDEKENRPPFVMFVPLQEIISEAIGSPVTSPKTQGQYDGLVKHFGGEFQVLLHADLKEITKYSTVEIADGIRKVRTGDIVIDPGYDGVFGVVKIWKSQEEKSLVDKTKEQLGLF